MSRCAPARRAARSRVARCFDPQPRAEQLCRLGHMRAVGVVPPPVDEKGEVAPRAIGERATREGSESACRRPSPRLSKDRIAAALSGRRRGARGERSQQLLSDSGELFAQECACVVRTRVMPWRGARHERADELQWPLLRARPQPAPHGLCIDMVSLLSTPLQSTRPQLPHPPVIAVVVRCSLVVVAGERIPRLQHVTSWRQSAPLPLPVHRTEIMEKTQI
eukprot:scaffold266597_cov24-Tisochrysis_lutea.AAC.2